MISKSQQTLDNLFLYLIKVYSSSQTSIIGLKAISTAIDQLECSEDEIIHQINSLSDHIKQTQPRMFPLDNLLLIFDKEMASETGSAGIEAVCQTVKGHINSYIQRLEDDLEKLIENGVKTIEDGDLIVIHSIEENIETLIPAARRHGKIFKVLILKQDFATTGQVIKHLNDADIDFMVIPEFDLVHHFEQADKLFIGTQALTVDNHLICDPGSSNIVSECHLNKIPVYLFMKSLKISHFPVDEQNIKTYEFTQKYAGIEYKEMFHSNDIVNLDLVDHIIIEEGEISIDEIDKYRLEF